MNRATRASTVRFEPGGPPDRPAREPSEYGEDPGF